MRLSHAVSLAAAAAAALGCTGAIEGRDEPAPAGASVGAIPNQPRAGAAPPASVAGGAPPASASPSLDSRGPRERLLRRLTRWEYDNTVRDLLGVEAKAASEFPAEELVAGFDNDGRALTFPAPLAEQSLATAERLGVTAAAMASRWAPCVATARTAACARDFVAAFGERAWRRPLAPDEQARYEAVFAVGLESSFSRGLELAATALLTSLPFHYRVETGEPIPGKPGQTRPTAHDLAARLSYLLWGSLPDNELLARARASGLTSREDVRRQAERMLGDPRSRRMIARFHELWLGLGGIASANKDPELHRDYTSDIPGLLRTEVDLFLDAAATGGGLADLFTGRTTFMNGPLARFYGVRGPAGAAFEPVVLDPARHAGLVTRAGVLAMTAGFAATSPTRRGFWVRQHLLCQQLPPPPPGVEAMAPASSPSASRRAQTEAHAADPACRQCHRLLDPIGFGLEAYDATGRWRDRDGGMFIDDRGEVADSDIGSFRGPVELASGLLASPSVRDCFARSWWRFAMGQQAVETDRADLERVAASSRTHRSLLLAVVDSESFVTLPQGGAR